MKTYSKEDFDIFEKTGDGRIKCPSGSYLNFNEFPDKCIFTGESIFNSVTKFGNDTSFWKKSVFGNFCVFGRLCCFPENTVFGYGCIFGDSCTFKENTIFSHYCVIGEKARIYAHTIISDTCIVGQNCLLWDKGSYLKGSINRKSVIDLSKTNDNYTFLRNKINTSLPNFTTHKYEKIKLLDFEFILTNLMYNHKNNTITNMFSKVIQLSNGELHILHIFEADGESYYFAGEFNEYIAYINSMKDITSTDKSLLLNNINYIKDMFSTDYTKNDYTKLNNNKFLYASYIAIITAIMMTLLFIQSV